MKYPIMSWESNILFIYVLDMLDICNLRWEGPLRKSLWPVFQIETWTGGFVHDKKIGQCFSMNFGSLVPQLEHKCRSLSIYKCSKPGELERETFSTTPRVSEKSYLATRTYFYCPRCPRKMIGQIMAYERRVKEKDGPSACLNYNYS